MNKKITYLLLALALPGLIFIFLKVFGKNHFDIPVYYQEGISGLPTECTGTYQGQYALPDSSLHAFGYKHDVACLFVDSSAIANKEIKQLRQAFGESQLQIISLAGIKPNRLNPIKNCVLFLKEPWQAVLVDKQKRIRGYYGFTSLEEADRLKVEIDILLTNN
jgi:protein SCO1/2